VLYCAISVDLAVCLNHPLISLRTAMRNRDEKVSTGFFSVPINPFTGKMH
jgi:hypothetical protein